MKKVLGIGAVLVLVAIAIGGVFAYSWYKNNLTVDLPDYTPPAKLVRIDQKWTTAQRDWFHHADQGTQTFGISYEWFMALEQPGLCCSSPELLSDQAYLDRFGFIPDTSETNATKLPIGFARGVQIFDDVETPASNSKPEAQPEPKMTSLGLTCAACHTGRLEYQDTTFLIEGGPALTDVNNFQKAVAISVLLTSVLPSRFNRFAARVLGPDAGDDAKIKLRAALKRVATQMGTVHDLEDSVKTHSIEEGYTRLDALSRIGNTVFAMDMNQPQNFVSYSAPVHFPRIWYAPWFLWVQYNGSIKPPMVRNAGEALGVRATMEFPVTKGELPASSVEVGVIYDIEHLIAGATPPDAKRGFSGLQAPKWRDAQVLPELDAQLIAAGAVLYKEHCEKCHLPATNDPGFWTSPQWTPPNASGERYLDLKMVDISYLGTDSSQAADMQKRTVTFPANLGITDVDGNIATSGPFGPALGQLVSKVVTRWYDDQVPPTSAADRDRMNGHRPDGIRAELQYKARPLTGIWATPPYLHNSSVPNLYSLLSPVEERPKTFYLGNREYDPVDVGYQTGKLPGGFLFDTSLRGNSNAGHEFNNGSGPGIIGPLLTAHDRRALIEFLKSL